MAHIFCVQHHHLRSEVHWIRRYVKQQQQQQIPVTQRSTHPHTHAYWTSFSSSRTKRAKVSRCGSVDSVSTDTSSYYCQLTLLRQMLCNSKRRGTAMHQVHTPYLHTSSCEHAPCPPQTDRPTVESVFVHIPHVSGKAICARFCLHRAGRGERWTENGIWQIYFWNQTQLLARGKQFGYVGSVTLQSGAILRELALRSSFIEVVLH